MHTNTEVRVNPYVMLNRNTLNNIKASILECVHLPELTKVVLKNILKKEQIHNVILQS